MKTSRTITLLLLIISCISVKAQIEPVPKRDWKKYIPQKQLLEYVNSAPLISKSATESLPFKNLNYNKVIAYDYEGNEEQFNSITKGGNFIPVVTQQKFLNHKQVERIIALFTDEKTYGETTAACFNPHMAVVFYNGNEIVFTIDICLGCNYLNASKEIPAMKHNKITFDDGDFYYAIGFTESGKRKIRSFSKELGFFYGE